MRKAADPKLTADIRHSAYGDGEPTWPFWAHLMVVSACAAAAVLLMSWLAG